MVWKCNLNKKLTSSTSNTKLPCLDKNCSFFLKGDFGNFPKNISWDNSFVHRFVKYSFIVAIVFPSMCVSCLHDIYHTSPCYIMTGETPILSLAMLCILFISYHVMVKYFSRFLSFLPSWMFWSGNMISSSLVPLLINLALITTSQL